MVKVELQRTKKIVKPILKTLSLKERFLNKLSGKNKVYYDNNGKLAKKVSEDHTQAYATLTKTVDLPRIPNRHEYIECEDFGEIVEQVVLSHDKIRVMLREMELPDFDNYFYVVNKAKDEGWAVVEHGKLKAVKG